jgi:hypothetical protein
MLTVLEILGIWFITAVCVGLLVGQAVALGKDKQ